MPWNTPSRFAVCAFVVILTASSPSSARSKFTPTPLPYSCDTVRWAAAKFSPEHLRKLSKQFHVTLTGSQLREAQKCLGKKGAQAPDV